MHVAVIGISHKTAPLYTREAISQACEELFDPKTALLPNGSFVLLSTCNRIEIYFSSSDLACTHSWILGRLRQKLEFEFEPHLYAYFGSDAFLHLAQVTSGLDSALLGECEIQGQVKRAYTEAHQYAFLSSELHYVFQKGLKIGKELRTRFSTEKKTPPLAKALMNALLEVFPNTEGLKILFVGYSKTNLSIYHALKGYLHNVSFCNRSYEKMAPFLRQENLSSIYWNKKGKWTEFDVVIFGTHAGKYLALSKELLEAPYKKRALFDLSVPRNVEPSLHYIKGTYLWNLEQLHALVQSKINNESQQWQGLAKPALERSIQKYCTLYKLKTLRFQGSVEKGSHPEYSPFPL